MTVLQMAQTNYQHPNHPGPFLRKSNRDEDLRSHRPGLRRGQLAQPDAGRWATDWIPAAGVDRAPVPQVLFQLWPLQNPCNE